MALLAASGIAAALFSLFTSDLRIFPWAFIITAIVATIFGLPAYGVARAAERETPLVACLAGFGVGAVVPAMLILSGTGADQASVGGTATVIDGAYTAAGWLQNIVFIGGFGLLGAVGGLLFWFGVDGWSQGEGTPSRILLYRDCAFAAVALASIAAVFIVPSATKDHSCHNPLRGGQSSIGTIASFELKAGPDDWRDVEVTIQQFARQGGWSVISDVRPDEEFKWFQMSLCREPGTNILIDGVTRDGSIGFNVYQPQGGASWEVPFRSLYRAIDSRWPNRTQFRGNEGQVIETPIWVTGSGRTDNRPQ